MKQNQSMKTSCTRSDPDLAPADKPDLTQSFPKVNFNPGPEYGDEHRYFGICSSIVKTPGGRLWCGFSSGGLGEGQFNYGVLVTSNDDGRTWSRPQIVFDTDGDGPIRSDHVVCWVSPAGQLWIMWSQYPCGLCGPGSSEWAITCGNPDAETPEWTAPRKLADGQNLLNKPIVLSDGSWLFPTGSWHYNSGTSTVRDYDFPSRPLLSNDGGRTFHLGGPLIADERPDFDEYMVVERADGTLVLFNRAEGFLEGTSRNRGRSWSKLQLNAIPHTSARFVFMKLQSGNWLLVKHGNMEKVAGRTQLTAFLSPDEGRSWTGGLMLDERAVSYPDGFQAWDGRIYVSYERNRHNNPEILLAVFAEADVAAGRIVGKDTRLKIQINKAIGDKAVFQADPKNAKYL
ncbi:MAG: sialidase family protein [Victivallales bacterium]